MLSGLLMPEDRATGELELLTSLDASCAISPELSDGRTVTFRVHRRALASPVIASCMHEGAQWHKLQAIAKRQGSLRKCCRHSAGHKRRDTASHNTPRVNESKLDACRPGDVRGATGQLQ